MEWSLPGVLQVQIEIRRASDGSILSPAHGLWSMSDDIRVTAEGILRSGPPPAAPIPAEIHPDTQAGVPTPWTHLLVESWQSWTAASKAGGPDVMTADRHVLANSITPKSVMDTNVAMVSLAEGIGTNPLSRCRPVRRGTISKRLGCVAPIALATRARRS
jgi:hypothetical protein